MACVEVVSDKELCPCCGTFVPSLAEDTGWCDYCTVEHKWPGRDIVRCANPACDRPFPAVYKPGGTYFHKVCTPCKYRGVTVSSLLVQAVALEAV